MWHGMNFIVSKMPYLHSITTLLDTFHFCDETAIVSQVLRIVACRDELILAVMSSDPGDFRHVFYPTDGAM